MKHDKNINGTEDMMETGDFLILKYFKYFCAIKIAFLNFYLHVLYLQHNKTTILKSIQSNKATTIQYSFPLDNITEC